MGTVLAGVTLSLVRSTSWLPFPRFLLLFACTALVVGFTAWSPAVRMSHRRAISWLGSGSFSLHLVHEPIVGSAARRLGSADVLVVWKLSRMARSRRDWILAVDPDRRRRQPTGVSHRTYEPSHSRPRITTPIRRTPPPRKPAGSTSPSPATTS